HASPTRPKSGRAKPLKTLGLRWDGLAGVTPAGGLLISRVKVRFLHGSPAKSEGCPVTGAPLILSLLPSGCHPEHERGSRARNVARYRAPDYVWRLTRLSALVGNRRLVGTRIS